MLLAIILHKLVIKTMYIIIYKENFDLFDFGNNVLEITTIIWDGKIEFKFYPFIYFPPIFKCFKPIKINSFIRKKKCFLNLKFIF